MWFHLTSAVVIKPQTTSNCFHFRNRFFKMLQKCCKYVWGKGVIDPYIQLYNEVSMSFTKSENTISLPLDQDYSRRQLNKQVFHIVPKFLDPNHISRVEAGDRWGIKFLVQLYLYLYVIVEPREEKPI